MFRSFLRNNSAVLFIIAIAITAHFHLLKSPGFFQDDWHHIYYAYARGTNSLWTLTASDGRPFSAWFYILAFSYLGVKPLYWQLWTLLLRIATGSVFLLVLDQLWPNRKNTNLITIGLFLIYPGYTLQALSVAYGVHWASYLLIATSFLLTVYAVKAKDPKKVLLLTSFSVLLEVLHLITIEYFIGLEFVRFLIILLSIDESFNWRVIKRSAATYLPYLLALAAYIVWRTTFANSLISRNEVVIFNDLINSPINTIKTVLNHFIPDLAYVLHSPFAKLISPGSLYFNQRFEVTSYIIGFAIAVSWFYLFGKWTRYLSLSDNMSFNEQFGPILLGVGIILFGILPGYAGYYFIQTKISPWNERFALPILLGLSLVVVELIHFFVGDRSKRDLIFAILIGFIVAFHIRSDQNFVQAWNDESSFYEQLTLRVPDYKPGTSLISNNEFLGRMGDYPTSFALNTLYSDPISVTTNKMDLWLFTYSGNLNPYVNELTPTTVIQDSKYSSTFEGTLGESIVISFEPELGQCLWIITPGNAYNKLVPLELQELSQFTNLDQIIFSDRNSVALNSIVPSHSENWCDVYQMASVAEQQGRPDKVIELWDYAVSRNFGPQNGFEMLPFISAFQQTGDFQQAAKLTIDAKKFRTGLAPSLCQLWQLPVSGVVDPEAFNSARKSVVNKLRCENL